MGRAVALEGPVVVSVDASEWFPYHSGVFDSCSRDAVVNHAVVLVGYGRSDAEGQWWSIRNSWGKEWGEKGHIRVLRHEEDQAYCGIDRKPQDGFGCKGGAAEVPVCGMCD